MCVVTNCRIYVHTSLNALYLGGGTNAHFHALNPESIEVKQVRQQVKEHALNEMTPVGMVYDEEMTKVAMNSPASAIFPTNTEINQGSGKARRRAIPLLPQSC